MIVEQRTYTLRTGCVPDFVALVRDEGLAIQKPHLGSPLGYFTSESGTLNQVVHLWGYASAADRETRRAALAADPAWQGFAPRVLPLIERMESRILIPTEFSAIGGAGT
ncbi:NIPSNAP family protein [Oceanibacterium hippocampi]|uniref:NIPSNAP domain-containing protein n=1 Tax=Oceanibacterium hippocampi TaxID=745714 RepID=A0A1Y5TK47_9PROT|nr:NIPSNAP family protein [Oceanibacterium hippocampi]SLN65813.1 hypothetical protein OCH7691_03021 [Oceanibacterium hippocampi]